jgi:hypothetical protein
VDEEAQTMVYHHLGFRYVYFNAYIWVPTFRLLALSTFTWLLRNNDVECQWRRTTMLTLLHQQQMANGMATNCRIMHIFVTCKQFIASFLSFHICEHE